MLAVFDRGGVAIVFLFSPSTSARRDPSQSVCPAETARPPEGLESYKLVSKPHAFPGEDEQKAEVRIDVT